MLWHDTQGMCLFAKRLERGRFVWPSPAEGAVTITPAQLGCLLEGIVWTPPAGQERAQTSECTGSDADLCPAFDARRTRPQALMDLRRPGSPLDCALEERSLAAGFT